MPTFYYRVATTDGSILEQREQADNELGLRQRLEKEGYLVLSISSQKGGIAFASSQELLHRRFTGRDFLVFNQEFLALLRAGLPVLKIFEILIDRSPHPGFHASLSRIREEIRTGSAISDAMSRERRYFSELYVSSLRAGEKSGNLAEIVIRYIDYQKKLLAVRKKVVSALAYPSFLLAVGLGVMAFLLIYVMPTFAQIYQDSKDALPHLTLWLLRVVSFLRANTLPLVGLLIVSAIGLRLFFRTPAGKKAYDRLILTTPWIRSIVLKHYVIQMCRTLGTVLRSGIPMVMALQMTGEAMANGIVASKIRKAMEKVREGGALSQALTEMGLLPKMAIEMVGVGETTGSLEEMLFQVADFTEDELDLLLSRVTTWVEPILLLIMGGIVAMILIAMYLPVFNLAGTIR